MWVSLLVKCALSWIEYITIDAYQDEKPRDIHIYYKLLENRLKTRDILIYLKTKKPPKIGGLRRKYDYVSFWDVEYE